MSTKELKILIVEDEKVLSFVMEEMLGEYGYNNTLIANSYSTAIAKIDSEKIDLAILDINLGNGPNGIDLAKECAKKQIPFFYVTSYTDKKILDLALNTVPGGYVVKPVTPASLYSAIKIIFNTINEDQHYFNFKDGAINVRLKTNEILFIQAEGVYLKVVTSNKNYLIRSTLASALLELPLKQFIQVHRSFIVNIDLITESKSDILFINNHQIPISRTFKDEFRERFSK